MNDPLNVLTLFLFNIVLMNIPLLYGTVGEIVVEKAGSLDLGVEGTMAVGAIFGYLAGCMADSLIVGLLAAFLAAGLCGGLFALLTVTFQANQNVTGLTITTSDWGCTSSWARGSGRTGPLWPALPPWQGASPRWRSPCCPGSPWRGRPSSLRTRWSIWGS